MCLFACFVAFCLDMFFGKLVITDYFLMFLCWINNPLTVRKADAINNNYEELVGR